MVALGSEDRIVKRLLQLTCLASCLVVSAASAKMLVVAAPPVPQRVAAADLIAVGKATGFGDKLVASDLFKGDDRQMQVAKFQVTDTVTGKAGKTIDVGFFPPPAPQPGRPGRMFGSVQFLVGQEALVYVVKHPTKKDFYVAQMYYDVVNKKDNDNFATELAEAKKYAKLLGDPKTSLESKDARERLTMANMLITRYRTQVGDGTKTEAIPADESKKLLTILADADWKARNPRDFATSPLALFLRLGLTDKDGWNPPEDGNVADAAKKWLTANAGTYRIQRFARGDADK